MTEKIRGRLAPTPSGYLHLGNLLNFVLTWALVRQKGGELFLRIDDHDEGRRRDHFVEQIYEDLKWLGFDWDHDLGSQVTKKEQYREQLNLCASHLFACSCSRKDLEGSRRYPKTCYDNNDLKQKEVAIRMRGVSDDPILWRKDDIPAYHWVSLLEDREHHINLIVRGDDLFNATQIQKEIEQTLFPHQLIFSNAQIFHHPMILDQDGKKLSKSDGAMSLQAMKAAGMTPKDVFIKLSKLMGIPKQTQLKDFLAQDLLDHRLS